MARLSLRQLTSAIVPHLEEEPGPVLHEDVEVLVEVGGGLTVLAVLPADLPHDVPVSQGRPTQRQQRRENLPCSLVIQASHCGRHDDLVPQHLRHLVQADHVSSPVRLHPVTTIF